MWQDFTEKGKKVFQTAKEEALRLGHEAVGTEHILLALLSDAGGVVPKVINSYGVTPALLKEELEHFIGGGGGSGGDIDIPTTPGAKLVFELSMKEAAGMGVRYVGTEHILLGIIAERDGMAAQLLATHGMTLPSARQRIADICGGATPERQACPSKAPGGRPSASAKSQQSKTPVLDQTGVDLSEMAANGGLDPVVGRELEIKRVVRTLSRRTKNNPVLIGEPGVGKTAIVEGLTQKILSGDIPETLRGKRVVQLNVANLVAGTKYRGEFEERMRRLVNEISTAKNVIVFIDEIHTIVGAGGAEGSVDVANILKPSLARGEFQVIGATTITEYRKYIEKDAALERRFQPVMVSEPSLEDTVAILKGLRGNYEGHHKVRITDEAIRAAAYLSQRYIPDRFLPDKAIDLIDEASSRVRIRTMETPEEIKQLMKDAERLKKEKQEAVQAQEFEKAAYLRDEEQKITEQAAEERRRWNDSCDRLRPDVSEEEIAFVVSEWTGIPVTRLTEEESRRLLKMERVISEKVIGQDEAISAMARAVRRARSGMKDPKRPAGSFLFLGPTGVGKTESARRLAEFLFGSEDAMIRVDMSEYMERHEAAKLIGAPPGYVGFEEGGKLTEAVRRRPYSVILFDEIEKAHPDVFNILLQLLEDGRLTDGHGRVTDFRNAVVIMTSNAGVTDAMNAKNMGFSHKEDDGGLDWDKLKISLMDAAKKTFRPEFINRVDEILVFKPLQKDSLLKIVDIMLADVLKRAGERGVAPQITQAAKQRILDRGYDPKYGARPLRRCIQKMVEDELSVMLLDGRLAVGDSLIIDAENGKLTFSKK